MDNCAKCGKELVWNERHAYWNRQLRHGYLDIYRVKKECPDYKDKKLCKSCALTLLNVGQVCKAAAMNNCAKCGKDLGWSERRSLWYQSYKICKSCYFQYRNDLKNSEVKTCNKCGYFEEVRHERGGVDSLGSYFDETLSSATNV